MAKWIVDDNGNGDFNTISKAIAIVASGDKIIVTGGDDNIHRETNIVVDKELTITSDHNGVTVDGQEENRVFLIDDDDDSTQLVVKFDNLTITGGNANDLGGAILNRENLTVTHTIITGNTAQLRGGGIYNLDGELKINRSVISNNVSLVASGGGR